jgi:four helix bundle protein
MSCEQLKQRTKQFTHRCVKLALSLPQNKLGAHIQGQLIRCSTSVAANYRASCLAISKASFISKISIVLEEVDESQFWLEFIIDENLKSRESVISLLDKSKELTAIFFTSRKTARLGK